MNRLFAVPGGRLMVALLTANVAAEMPDMLGIRLEMAVRDADANREAQLPTNKTR